jgi:phage tail-like protein
MTPDALYPPPAFQFSVVILEGNSAAMPTRAEAQFQEVSGIDLSVASEDVEEGGDNRYVHRLPAAKTHRNLVLKRGSVIAGSPIADWAAQTVGSTLATPIRTQTLRVSLLDPDGKALRSWTFSGAWPVKWVVATLDTNDRSTIMTEALEIAYTSVARGDDVDGDAKAGD